MIVPIIYPSAGEFWLKPNPYPMELSALPAGFNFNSKAASNIAKILDLSKPLFITAPHEKYKRTSSYCVIRSHQYPFPPDSFYHFKTDEYDIYVSCPELTFLTAARTLDFIDLIMFGYDLCALQNTHRNPVTSVLSLKEYAIKNSFLRGSKKALNALRYVRDSSNSPMETRLAIFSVLPPKLGGCGLPKLEMNRAINLTLEGRMLMGCAKLRGDLVFNETLDVEYNSNAFHLSSIAYTNDMNRQTAVKLAGFQYIGVTYGNIKYYHSIIVTMNAIRRALKMDPLEDNPARAELYDRLFGT